MPVLPLYLAGQSVDTQLTPSCDAQVAATFDLNDSTWVTFYYQNKVPLWQALLSVANQEISLDQSFTACGITLCEGLKATLNPMGSVYTVLLYGAIVDAGTPYRFAGLFLGSFSRSDTMKSAVRSIRNGASMLRSQR